jgi:ppGpp synthetase/RelA/SpoT-type nucleotidyltranferase
MAEKKKITSPEHKKQIEAYTAVFPCYKTYAEALKRVLEEACKTSFPEAFIQSRPKAVSSFAEKTARKFDKYPDAVNQMTDLCGARVIVQTTEQVKAVRRFIEANFKIVEKEDKGLLLSEQEFGYRDMHYIVQLRAERDEVLGIASEERAQILDRCAEIQVRTWVQHAWADTLHDRIYKSKLNISSEAKRTGNLLAALMEEADHNFSRLADELDGLIANYTAMASRKKVKEEIEIQKLIFDNETDDKKRRGLAMKLARLLAACGDYDPVEQLLSPYCDVEDANRCELLLDIGYALCRQNRTSPSSAEYRRGLKYLKQTLTLCESVDIPFVPNLRKRESLHARALSRLGWALEPIQSETKRAREYYQLAHEHEPDNPYYLANMLGLEMSYGNRSAFLANMRTAIREAVKTCRKHAVAGIELPYAYFTGGRLNLLLGDTYAALGCYARGIQHCLAGLHCIPDAMFAGEMDWLINAYRGDEIPQQCRYVIELLSLAKEIEDGNAQANTLSSLQAPVLIIAGGAAGMDAKTLEAIRPLLLAGLADFSGTVIAGGTTVGVPGCIGDIAGDLANENKKHFKLIGYLPERMPNGVSAHKAYDACVAIGEDFLPDQILRNWRDILESGIKPQDVLLLGLGGGMLSAFEYRIALSLGAAVGVVDGLKGATDDLLKDPLWQGLPNLYPIPFDPATVRAFIIPPDHPFEDKTQEEMAKSFHAQYVANSSGRLPANMKPWHKLDETFKKANLEQAKYSVEILQGCGFGVVKVDETPKIFEGFTDSEVECMAEMEHGRWNVERLRNGWRYGKIRDDDKKIHDCLVPWSQLPEGIKGYDREAIRAFPVILAQAGLEIFRRNS